MEHSPRWGFMHYTNENGKNGGAEEVDEGKNVIKESGTSVV